MKPNGVELNLAKPIFYLFFIVCLLWIRTESVEAHRVNLFAWIEGDTVYVESKFSGGKPVNAGKIIVSGSEGTELLSGTTDENGKFFFKIPRKSELKIVLEAGTGHQAEWTIAADEIERSAAGKKPDSEEARTVKGIIIGLAFIFGLTGLVTYIRKRKS